MVTVAFSNHGFLVEREVMNALRAMPQVKLVVVDSAPFLNAEQARLAAQVLAEQQCNILFTINNHGMDTEGVLANLLERQKIVHVNWWVDDPFFLETIHAIPLFILQNRIDLVSDRGYVQAMRERGMRAFFLPLASDPELFHPAAEPPEKLYPASFVGNSYVADIEDLLKDHAGFMEEHLAFVNECQIRYSADIRFPLETAAERYVAGLALPSSLSRPKAVFLIKHFVGFLYRKKTVMKLAERFDAFMVAGDAGWKTAIPENRMVRQVGYYLGLNEMYQKTGVNIDINRVVIRDGFTQRVFDCLASGSFIITSPKPVVGEFFQTSGRGQEIAVFENEESLLSQVEYFINHPGERQAIALRGQKKVLAEHTYQHRMQTIFRILHQELGKI
jgi:spore maturation protein CgeB